MWVCNGRHVNSISTGIRAGAHTDPARTARRKPYETDPYTNDHHCIDGAYVGGDGGVFFRIVIPTRIVDIEQGYGLG